VALAMEHVFEGPAERAVVLGLIARAAGGTANAQVFEQARTRLDELLSAGAEYDTSARALLGVSYGAGSLALWELAEETALRALALATTRREGRVVMAAEAALEFVRSRPEPSPQAPPEEAQAALVSQFVQALHRRPVLANA
jgi:hypothetical protein